MRTERVSIVVVRVVRVVLVLAHVVSEHFVIAVVVVGVLAAKIGVMWNS